MTDFDRESLNRILPAPAGTADWEDVLSRSGSGKPRRGRLVIAFAVAVSVVVVVSGGSVRRARPTLRNLGGGER